MLFTPATVRPTGHGVIVVVVVVVVPAPAAAAAAAFVVGRGKTFIT